MEIKSKLMPIIILVSAILIGGALLLNALSDRYKVVGNRVFDTFKGMYVDNNKIDNEHITDDTPLTLEEYKKYKEKNNSEKTWLDNELERID